MTARYPIAYVRRSSADANDRGDVSREAQEAAVRELARRDGHNGDLRILEDWDRSADDAKEARRTAFLAMLAAIERGEVSAVYAASLDRLYRSMRTFVRLTDAAKAHDVRIVTLREGVLGGDGSPMAQAFAEITAVFSGLELRTTKARAASSLAVRRGRGDKIGRAGYGFRFAYRPGPDGRPVLLRDERGSPLIEADPERPLAPVLDAVREAGGILPACKLLNARGVPVPQGPSAERRNGSAHWHPMPLRRIIERNAPALLPPKGASGRRQPTNARLAQLLLCHCGHVLTPQGHARYGRPAYRCTVGNRIGREAHGPLYVTEAAILPAIMAEVARLRLPVDVVTIDGRDVEAERADLAAQRARLALAFARGGLPEDTYTAEDTPLAARLAELAERSDVASILPVSPLTPAELDALSPAAVNAYFRAILRRVRLGPDLRPLPFTLDDWRNPALRS